MADEDTFAQAQEEPEAPAADDPLQAVNIEKRAFARINTHWQGAVILAGRPVMGKITDVSRGGISFLCEQSLPLHSKQVIFIRMPNNDRTGYHQLETLCQITNTILVAKEGVYRMGAKFLELRGNTESILMHFINTHGG